MRIGPSFAAEIAAAGLLGLPFSWSEDGVLFGGDISEAERARVEAVVAAHDPKKEPPPPVPQVISDRQFAQALAKLGIITREEALQFVKVGAVPDALQAVIDAVPDADARFGLDMAVSGATQFERSHPSTVALAEALRWSPGQMDDLWRSAAEIR